MTMMMRTSSLCPCLSLSLSLRESLKCLLPPSNPQWPQRPLLPLHLAAVPVPSHVSFFHLPLFLSVSHTIKQSFCTFASPPFALLLYFLPLNLHLFLPLHFHLFLSIFFYLIIYVWILLPYSRCGAWASCILWRNHVSGDFSYPILSYSALSFSFLPNSILSYPILSCLVLFIPTQSRPVCFSKHNSHYISIFFFLVIYGRFSCKTRGPLCDCTSRCPTGPLLNQTQPLSESINISLFLHRLLPSLSISRFLHFKTISQLALTSLI